MNYYAARQRESDGRWDYTVRNDDRIHAVGYCTEYRPFKLHEYGATQDFIDRMEATKDKFHTDGHASEDEACECYRQYLLDHRLRLNQDYVDEQHRCEICQEWTSLYAEMDLRLHNLCEKHNNRETFEKISGKVGQIWSS